MSTQAECAVCCETCRGACDLCHTAMCNQHLLSLPDIDTFSKVCAKCHWQKTVPSPVHLMRRPARFSLGQTVATRGALKALEGDDPRVYLGRHVRGDWGEVEAGDWTLNNESLQDGTRLLSAYTTQGGERIWLITEADRSATTILLPEEY